jgi:hypothetical protein
MLAPSAHQASTRATDSELVGPRREIATESAVRDETALSIIPQFLRKSVDPYPGSTVVWDSKSARPWASARSGFHFAIRACHVREAFSYREDRLGRRPYGGVRGQVRIFRHDTVCDTAQDVTGERLPEISPLPVRAPVGERTGGGQKLERDTISCILRLSRISGPGARSRSGRRGGRPSRVQDGSALKEIARESTTCGTGPMRPAHGSHLRCTKSSQYR